MNQFTGSSSSMDFPLIDATIPPLISDAMNESLIQNPSMEEVKSVVFSLNSDAALGLMLLMACFTRNVGT